MFRQMNRISLAAATASVLFLSPGFPAASAQPATPAKKQASAPKLDQSLYFDLDFPGGTLAQYIEAIRKAHGSANVMLSEDAKTMRIPTAKLNGVTLEAAVQLLGGQILTRNENSYTINAQRVDLGRWHEYAFSISAYPFKTAADRLEEKQSESKTYPQAVPVESSVWSLRDLIDSGMKMDDVLGAITVALETINQPYKVQIHKPTTLLIVRGTAEQLALVNQMVSAVEEDARNRVARSGNAANDREIFQSRLVEAQADMRVAGKKLEVASLEVKRFKVSFEKRRADASEDQKAASEITISKLELTQIKAQGALQMAMKDVETLSKRLNRLGRAKAGGGEHD